jgi:hypothetical protein
MGFIAGIREVSGEQTMMREIIIIIIIIIIMQLFLLRAVSTAKGPVTDIAQQI